MHFHAPPHWDIAPSLQFTSEFQFSTVQSVHFSSEKKKFNHISKSLQKIEVVLQSDSVHMVKYFMMNSSITMEEFNNHTLKLAKLIAIEFYLLYKIFKRSSRFKST